MKINNTAAVSFSGYDAVPLKTLHMGTMHERIEKELKQIAENEGFNVKTSDYNESFNQDFKVILNKDNMPKLFMRQNIGLFQPLLADIEKEYEMSTTIVPMFPPKSRFIRDENIISSGGFISGGNFFLGKKPDGTKWLLIGASEQSLHRDPFAISKLYDVPLRNIHFLPQEDYHLDLSLRPIGYPYVLVNNPRMASKNESKIRNQKQKTTQKTDTLSDLQYNSHKKSIEILENAGFIPIPIGGVYNNGINFMNAVVNRHPDGTISYITNSSKSTDPRDTKYQRMFEKDLRNKLKELSKEDKNAPRLRDIYFIEGELYDYGNEMTDNILEGAGGIHCMTLEEPNFEAWA
ncbi:MAG: hypothetical protein OSJ27_06140 [Candidatus Gastranaerophilales bacterium]|nr:hypothetical protein [Candidatus Gastranaerophilales bacterium]